MDPALHTLSTLATFMSVASVKGTLLVAAVLLVQKLVGRYLGAGARYMLWFPVIIALITPVGVNLPVPTGLMPVPRAPALAPAVTLPAADNTLFPTVTPVQDDIGAREPFSPVRSSASTQAGSAAADAGGPFSWFDLAVYVWLAGVLVVLGAVAGSCHRFFRIVNRATRAPEELQLFLQDCMAQTSCQIPVSVLHSAAIQVPMIAGLFKPVLLLPAGMEQQLTRAQLRHVFIHELMHLQRGDIISNWIVALAQALHWFNPAVWFAFYCMRDDRELACDAATLRYLIPADRLAYGHTLLRLNDLSLRTPVPVVALGILESSSHLQSRIHMLVQTSHPRKLQSCFAVVLLLLLAAVAISQPVPASVAAPRVLDIQPAALAEPAPATSATRLPLSVAESTPRPVAAVTEEESVPRAVTPVTEEESAPRAVIPVTEEESMPRPVVPVTEEKSLPRPVSPGTREVPAQPARPVERAQAVSGQIRPVAVEVPLLAQVDRGSVVDAFALPEQESTNVAAITTAQLPETPTVGMSIPGVVLQMTEAITALKTDQQRVIEEWNGIALACEGRKQNTVFGTLSAPCREVRVVQLRGEVFQFVYACHVLGLQQAAQWEAWREAVAQQSSGLNGVEEALLANEQELKALCSTDTYANEYPGFSKMLADAAALKYYNPWRRPYSSPPYQFSYPSDPLIWSRMADGPAF